MAKVTITFEDKPDDPEDCVIRLEADVVEKYGLEEGVDIPPEVSKQFTMAECMGILSMINIRAHGSEMQQHILKEWMKRKKTPARW